MEKEIEKLKQECDEYLAGWKRAKADLLNYKKEEAERMEQMAEYVQQALLLKVLPILDNIERALREVSNKDSREYKGFSQIAAQWKEFLKSRGIEEIESVGKPFNPETHEAIGETEGEKPGLIAEEIEKGYIMNNKLLRPAKVKVTK